MHCHVFAGMNINIWSLFFRVWLILVYKLIFITTHLSQIIEQNFLLLLNSIPLYICLLTMFGFFHSETIGHSGSFQLLAIVGGVIIKHGEQMFLQHT